jgi:outer membrane immunogenic protein
MRKILLATAVLTVLAAPAIAADLARPAPVYKAPPAPPPVYLFSWTGCYIGVNGGYGWQHDHANDVTFTSPAVAPVFFPSQNLSEQGGFGGGQVGCNYQAGWFVVGVEGDIQGSGIRDSFGPTLFTVPGVVTITASEKLNSFGTIRGRAGFAVDRALFYVTGGAAFGKTSYNYFAVDAVGNSVTLNGDTTRTGWVVGAGIEYAFLGGWTAKAEYQYLNFGDIGPLTGFPVLPAGVPTGQTTTSGSFRNDYHTFRIGLNYLFNSGRVVARY